MTTITEAVTRYRLGELTMDELIDDLRARTWRAPHVASAQPGDDADWSYVSTADAEGSWLELARAWAANLLTAEELRVIEAEVPFDALDDDDRETLGPSRVFDDYAAVQTFGRDRAAELGRLLDKYGTLGDEALDWNPRDHHEPVPRPARPYRPTITAQIREFRAGALTMDELIADLRGRKWRKARWVRGQPGDEGDPAVIDTEGMAGSWYEVVNAKDVGLLTTEELNVLHLGVWSTEQ